MIKRTTPMKIKYTDFLLESYLRTSDRLKDIIKEIDDPVAREFINLIDKDIKTTYNGLDLKGGEKDVLTFLQDSQFNNKLKNVESYKELIKDTNNTSGIGRIVNGILRDNGITFRDHDIERFVTKFKSVVDSKNVNDRIRLVKGDEIVKWYSCRSYRQEQKGTLWNSCMRWDSCEGFFGIYTENKNVSLVIMVDESDALVARALLWEDVYHVEGSKKFKYLDRIYYINPEDSVTLKRWVEENQGVKDFHDSGLIYNVELENVEFDEYPYMDTFKYCITSERIFTNYEDSDWDRKFENTDGSYRRKGIWSERQEEFIDERNAVFSDIYDSYIDRDISVYSQWMNDYILQTDSSWSDYLQDYFHDHIPTHEVYTEYEIKLVDDILYTDVTTDFLPTDYYKIVKVGEEYFINDLCYKIDGEWHPKAESIKYVDIDQIDIESLGNMVRDFIVSLGMNKVPVELLSGVISSKVIKVVDWVNELKPVDVSIVMSDKYNYGDYAKLRKTILTINPDIFGNYNDNLKGQWSKIVEKYYLPKKDILNERILNSIRGRVSWTEKNKKELYPMIKSLVMEPWGDISNEELIRIISSNESTWYLKRNIDIFKKDVLSWVRQQLCVLIRDKNPGLFEYITCVIDKETFNR